MANERILLRRIERAYVVLEEGGAIGEMPAARAYSESFDNHLILYAQRGRNVFLNRDHLRMIGIADHEEEADKRLYEYTLKQAEKLSKDTGKPLADLTQRVKEGQLAGKLTS